MLPAELQTFLESSPFKNETLEKNEGTHLSTTSSKVVLGIFGLFWKTPPIHYRWGQVRLPNERVLNLMIDEDDATTIVVYLMWHEM